MISCEKRVPELIAEVQGRDALFQLGEMANANQSLDEDTFAVLAGELGYTIEIVSPEDEDKELLETFDIDLEAEEAAETEEDLMHEELSRYSLEPSGYSGRILGWSAEAGDAPCQTFAVYRDGVWKTRGLFVTRARGRVDDLDDVLNGFCLRILGRLIDLASLSGGAGRRWTSLTP